MLKLYYKQFISLSHTHIYIYIYIYRLLQNDFKERLVSELHVVKRKMKSAAHIPRRLHIEPG